MSIQFFTDELCELCKESINYLALRNNLIVGVYDFCSVYMEHLSIFH